MAGPISLQLPVRNAGPVPVHIEFRDRLRQMHRQVRRQAIRLLLPHGRPFQLLKPFAHWISTCQRQLCRRPDPQDDRPRLSNLAIGAKIAGHRFQ